MENNFEKFDDQIPLEREEYDVSIIPVSDGGKLVLLARETMGTFTPEDEFELAKKGQIVLSVAFGQNVYQYVEDDAL